MASILVCDDQRSICEMLDISLRKEGHRVETVNAGEAAKKKLSSANYEVLITDIKMPQTDGIEVLHFARQSSPETSVILITAVEDYEAAVQAVRGGAFDYIHKGPGLLEELKISVARLKPWFCNARTSHCGAMPPAAIPWTTSSATARPSRS
jgi:DNA-binding NtrC family response regulator